MSNTFFERDMNLTLNVGEISKDIKVINTEINQVINSAQINFEKVGKTVKKTFNRDTFSPLKLSIKDITNTIGKVGGALSSSLKGAIMTGEFNFRQFAANIAGIFVDLGMKISQSLLDNVIQSIGSSFGSSGGSSGGGFGSMIGGFFSNFVGKIFGRANGGPVTGSSPYLIGEKGPELFIPNVSGKVISNTDTANMMGARSAGGANINFSVNAIDSSSFADFLSQPQSRNLISNFAVNAVQKQSNKRLNRSPFE